MTTKGLFPQPARFPGRSHGGLVQPNGIQGSANMQRTLKIAEFRSKKPDILSRLCVLYEKRRRNMNNLLVRTGSLIALASASLFLFVAPTTAQDDGAALYKTKCAVCHGADGKGDTPLGKNFKLRDLGSDEVQKQTDAELTAITADGKGKMPSYKGKLTDEQIKQLVAFMRSLKKK
jgi:cytochrome c6